MQQHVAQFLADIRLVVLEQGVAQFECLFYGVGSKRLVGLLAVPRTFLAQLVEHIQQTSESLEFFFSCMHSVYILNMWGIPIGAVYDNAKVRIKIDTINRIFQFHS